MPQQNQGPGASEPRERSELEDALGAQPGAEDDDIALLGDVESVDEVDMSQESWAPGEPAPGLAADEVLSVHPLTAREPSADVLDVGGEDLELPVPDEDEQAEAVLEEDDPGRALHRTALVGDLEIRYEELDPGIE